jgi:hypothetical protein
MRLGRRATLLVAFFLLISAATACAECAWVLWSRVTRTLNGSNAESVWQMEGYPTSVACEVAKQRTLAAASSKPGVSVAGDMYIFSANGLTLMNIMTASPTPWTRAGRRGSE